MTWQSFLAGCWGTHQEPIWRDNALHCLTCGAVIDVLPQAVVRGPKHDPEPVRGVPKMKAKVERSDNLRQFRHSER